jgi:flavin reductase (DIM6/NTAB) family NADH-FMN oxidoreductase RutF/rubredoxin
MIDFEALFKISYGLYIVSSGDQKKGNGYISNTVFQVTAEPPSFAVCCNKANYTADFIQKSGFFAVSILQQETSAEIFGRFGYRSGKDFNKLENMELRFGHSGVPIVLNDTIAFLECKLKQTFDVGTHLLFIGDLLHAEIIDIYKEPLTYSYYRKVKKGMAPKNAPTYIDKSKLETIKQEKIPKKFKCPICGYIYDEEQEKVLFNDLPEDWICPVCGTPKEDFIEVQ